MAEIITDTLASSQADLIRRIAEVLADHPAGGSFRLLFAPHDLSVAEDEVLIQVTNEDRGVIELHPRKVDDLDLNDVVHATQVLDPSDAEFNKYAESPKAASCLIRYDLMGKPVHIYD
jgi:hypothetical protein